MSKRRTFNYQTLSRISSVHDWITEILKGDPEGHCNIESGAESRVGGIDEQELLNDRIIGTEIQDEDEIEIDPF